MYLWIGFIVCSSVIVYSGSRLSKYGDIIAEKTGLGGAWTGVVLMGFVTSLPELVTGISSVTYAGVPDIAVGNVLGACVFNMLSLALLDAVYRPMPISAKAHRGHIISAAFGVLLLCIVIMSLFLGKRLFSFAWIGPYSPLFILIYFAAMRLIYSYEKRQQVARFIKELAAEEMKYGHISTKAAVSRYVAHAAVVIAAALFLPTIGEKIAATTGLGQTFVGSILVAFSTTLPELTVSVAALRMGAIDLAIGNLFGSNIFNIAILAIDDIFLGEGPILSLVDPAHAVSAASALGMTAIAIIGLTYRADRKRLFMSWDSIGITLMYIINLMILFMLK